MYHNYYLNHMEKRKAYAKEYGQKNRELISQKGKIYRETHKEQIKKYYEEHIDYYKEYKKTPRYKAQQKEYMKNNRDHYNEMILKWREQNPEKARAYKLKADKKYRDNHKQERKEYINANREYLNEQKRKREKYKRDTDSLYKLKIQLRGTIYSSFSRKGYKKGSHTYEILGCDSDTFIEYLLNTYVDNYGVEWDGKEAIHIDHIIPLSEAKNEKDVIALCYYKNLQLLKAKDNLDKNNKLDWKLENE